MCRSGSDGCGEVGGWGDGVFDRPMVRLEFLDTGRWCWFDDCVGECGCDGLSRKMSSFSRGLRPVHIVHLIDERKFMYVQYSHIHLVAVLSSDVESVIMGPRKADSIGWI